MSEEEETKCRLTYREGKRIAELAEKPFVKAKRWLFYMMIVMLLLFLGMSAYEKYNPPETPEEALEAGFTPEQSAFIGEHMRVALYVGTIFGMLSGTILILTVITCLQFDIRRSWLKAANEEAE